MRVKITFVVVFAAVILGLVQLHKYSLKESVTTVSSRVDINGIASFEIPNGIESRGDIPFGLLIDPELIKTIPEDTDFEKYRPHIILLKEGFDTNDRNQIKEFGNIVINGNVYDGFSADAIDENYFANIANSIATSVQNNLANTVYRVSDWTVHIATLTNGAKMLQCQYKQNKQEGGSTQVIVSCLFKDDKQIEATLSTPEQESNEWFQAYEGVLNSIEFR